MQARPEDVPSNLRAGKSFAVFCVVFADIDESASFEVLNHEAAAAAYLLLNGTSATVCMELEENG